VKIAVICGGFSNEAEISIKSGKNALNAIEQLGYECKIFDPKYCDLYQMKIDYNPDLCFILLHGEYGEDGRIQGYLDYLDLKYTFSSVNSSALAINKYISKIIAKTCDIDIIQDNYLTLDQILNGEIDISPPFIIKPNFGGSSIDNIIIENEKDFIKIKTQLGHREKNEYFIVEKFINGYDISTAILKYKDKYLIGSMAILPNNINNFCDFAAKYEENLKFIMPTPLDNGRIKSIEDKLINFYKKIDCNNIVRIDLRYDSLNDKIYFMEINNIPGYTEKSWIFKIMQFYHGLNINNITQMIIEEVCGKL